MENSLPINRPTRRDSINVSRIQFNHIFTDSAVAKGDELPNALQRSKMILRLPPINALSCSKINSCGSTETLPVFSRAWKKKICLFFVVIKELK